MSFLKINNISKQYAHHKALDDVSMVIPAQSVFGLLGPNGAGKTSLIRIITQITAPDSGEVLFDGRPLKPADIYAMGYLPEERGLYKKMEVGEQLLFFAQLKGLSGTEAKARLKAWVERFEIGNWWNKKVEELSKGMQQKIQFIATVLHEPKLIILDEPFSGFDPINANLIRDEILRLNADGATVIFSTHRMETVEQMCNNIALINRSKVILEGEVKEIRKAFSTNVFEVIHHSAEFKLGDGFKVISTVQHDRDEYLSAIQIIQGGTNELLGQLLQQTTVKGFTERIPDMNEIFIQAVKKNQPQSA
ncbi:MAG: ATP-binding cassette domain-containing protein [Bacteroidia bacterium]|nr:ATP-binding cassette domain-containing protein [Bacteroidia bacterium]MBP7261303.1 ATP-binding cassette domain-containing protein [Bacteroidia bacterium]MBP9180756.1 ATP-binding cassette domain-containing protein [Bacteroidia bacterium]MBP9725016.1 ATP-binding cassette domain-containing protein [Bacteroidia bacterium]